MRYKIPIHPIEKEVYLIGYNDVVVENSPALGDVCRQCHTPLYDDVYAVFPDGRSNRCQLYCAVCLHSRFDSEGHITSQDDGKLLYEESHVIGKLTYPRGVAEVIDMITSPVKLNMEPVKDILRASFSEPLFFEEHVGTPHSVVIIGYNPQQNKTDNIKYVGYTGGVGSFIYYAYQPDNTFQRLVGYRPAIQGLEKAGLFNCWIASTHA